MAITHEIRAVEYLSSTPKYNPLYASFGWPIPEYIHLPLIVDAAGRKLSKRAGDASFEDLVARGYLPDRINKSKASFSLDKLDWLNGLHIRVVAPRLFHHLVLPYYPAEAVAKLDTEKISALIQPPLCA